MIIACVIAYQEERMLPGCLDSLEGQVARVIVVDGRYAQFPDLSHEDPADGRSTDATAAIAEAFGAEVILPPGRPWATQMEKRSAYLVGEEGDRYLRIDADERLHGSLAGLAPGTDYALRIIWRGGHLQPWVPCLFEQRGEMAYQGAHCALWRDGTLISRRGECARWTQAFLLHLKEHRAAARQQAKQRYYAWQGEMEKAFRRKHDV